MKKIVKVGWVGKTSGDNYFQWDNGDLYLKCGPTLIYKDKANKAIWGADWPPRKVRITVEEIE